MLSVRDVHAAYGRIPVLRGLDLEVAEGAIVCLIGSNGAGKTTTLRTISGLVRPRSGAIELDGRSLVGMTADAIARAGVAHVPEGRGVFPELTVEENLRLGGLSLSHDELRAAIDRVVDVFPALHGRLGQKAGSLSGGEQQMLVIGRGLMSRPRLLMIDELSLGLAPVLVQRIFGIVRQLNEEGVTILLVEQFLNVVLPILDYGYVLEKGRVVAEGTRDEIAAQQEELKVSYLGKRVVTAS